MKITPDKLKAASFAISKRLQGYHLLKNSKDAPANQVNMIKVKHSINEFFDDKFIYERVSRTFENGEFSFVNKLMTATHYMNDITGKITNQKRIYYIVKGQKVADYQLKKREDLKPAELKFRHPVSFPSKNPLIQLGDYDRFMFERKQAEKDRNFYKTTDDYLTKIFSFGFFGNTSRPSRPNFFKVLFNNLNK